MFKIHRNTLKIEQIEFVKKIQDIESRKYCYFKGIYSLGIYYCLQGFNGEQYRLLNRGFVKDSGKIK